MPFASNKSRFRDMSPEELQHHVDDLYAKCNCDILSLSPEEHDELKAAAANYYNLTGEALQPSHSTAFLHS